MVFKSEQGSAADVIPSLDGVFNLGRLVTRCRDEALARVDVLALAVVAHARRWENKCSIEGLCSPGCSVVVPVVA